MTQIKYLDFEGLSYYDNKLKTQLNTQLDEVKVQSSDGTVNVTDGQTSSGSTTHTDLSVNVDGVTIIKETSGTNKGRLSVASSALTQYQGSTSINVSAVDANNNKTISLIIICINIFFPNFNSLII